MQRGNPQVSAPSFKKDLNNPKSLSTSAKVGIVLSTSVLLGGLTSFAIWNIMFNNDKVKNLQIKNQDGKLNDLDASQKINIGDIKSDEILDNPSIETDDINNQNSDEFLDNSSIETDGIKEKNNQNNNEILDRSKGKTVNEIKESSLDDLKSKLSLLGSKKHYVVGSNGKTNVSNPILDINLEQAIVGANINGGNRRHTFGLARLSHLCQKYGYTRGCESDDDCRGWEIPAYDYFFVHRENARYSNMYFQLSDYHKELLLKCLEFMFDNDKKDDSDKWKNRVGICLNIMSHHGAHCSWRAEAIVNGVYSALLQFLHEEKNILGNNLDVAFYDLKLRLVNNVQPYYMKLHPDDHEPLDAINDIMKVMKHKFGMLGGEKLHNNFADDYFKYAMKADNLIKLLYELANQLEEGPRKELMCNEDLQISFEEYCKYTMKTPEQIEEILDKIWLSNTEDAKKLKLWIQGKERLDFESMSYHLAELFGWGNECCVSDLTRYCFGLRFLINLVQNDYLWLVINDDNNGDVYVYE
jgi:hypothetical protein